MATILKARTSRHFHDAGALILEYQAYVDAMRFHACIAGDIRQEINNLSRVYPAERGGVFVAYRAEEALGCAALERQAEGIAEIRRLYVRSEARGQGLGKELIAEAVAEARRLGYHTVRLDTFRTVDFAGRIYRELGFNEIPPYNDLPPDRVVFMEQVLCES